MLTSTEPQWPRTDDIDGLNPGYAGLLGTGRIDAYDAILSIVSIVDPPVLISPINAVYIMGTYPTFIWHESDGAASYQIQVDDHFDFSSPFINNITVYDTTYASTYSFGSGVNNIWYWKVRAGSGGTWSDYSTAQTFRVDSDPPPVTTLLAPEDSSWIGDLTPMFEWQAVVDIGTGLDKYFIQVDNDPNFTSPHIIDDSTTFTFFETLSNLNSNVVYHWRVNARDNAGNYSDYATASFGIDLTPPSAPIDFEITPDGWTGNPDFTLTWENPNDSSGIAMALYKVGSAPESNFDTTGHFDSSPAGFFTGVGGSYPIFLWLIDSVGNVAYVTNRSDTAYFDNTPPSGCTASSPDTSGNESFTVSWTAGVDDASGISGLYDVKYKDGEGGSWIDWLIDFAGTSETFDGTDGHQYYFEARTSDIAGNYEEFTGIAETNTVVDTTYSGPDYLPGDANNSGAVNGLDVIFLVGFLKGYGPAPDPYLGGDANGSCSVNGLDVTYLVSFLKGGPAPFGGNCD
jgi:hypothetical protein